MRKISEIESDESSPTEHRPLTWLLVFFILAVFGVVACTMGVCDLLAGVSHQTWKGRGGVVLVDKTFTGGMAVAFGVAQIAMGLGCLPLSLLARPAMEAHARRGSYFALPRWQAYLLVRSLLLAASGLAFLMLGRFF
jgi:hypothetical protein